MPVLVVLMAAAIVLTMTLDWNAWEGPLVREGIEAGPTAEYVEKGGLQWGSTAWVWNMSWPFARIEIWRDRVYLTARLWKFVDVKFDLEKSDVQAVRKRRGVVQRRRGLRTQEGRLSVDSSLLDVEPGHTHRGAAASGLPDS
jgi:hypothetical protein